MTRLYKHIALYYIRYRHWEIDDDVIRATACTYEQTYEYKRDRWWSEYDYTNAFLSWVSNLRACDLEGVFCEHQLMGLFEECEDE